MKRVELCLEAADEDAMVALGARLAAVSSPPLVVFLRGALGMGKTTFSRGFIRALGHRGAVKSPTYTLVEPYRLGKLQVPVYHFDLYRLGDAEELEFMGIRDYFGTDTLCLVEWPERGEGVLPSADLVITMERQGAGRRLHLLATSIPGADIVAQLQAPP